MRWRVGFVVAFARGRYRKTAILLHPMATNHAVTAKPQKIMNKFASIYANCVNLISSRFKSAFLHTLR